MGALFRLDRLFARLELSVALTALASLVLLLIAQVFFRYVLKAPLFFAEEAALLLLIVASFAGLSLLVAERKLVAVDMVGAFVGPRLQRWIRWAAGIAVLLTAGVLAGYAVNYLTVPWIWLERSATVPMPRAVLYLLVTIELVLLCFHQAVQSIADFPAAAGKR